jgi:hypothetical protein
MDNAAIHSSNTVNQYIEINMIHVLYTGVASFNAILVELVFAYIKMKFQTWCDIIERRR